MPSKELDEIITPEERKEIERCVARINETLNVGAILAEALPDFIDARFGDVPQG
jgi:hypothetical protein